MPNEGTVRRFQGPVIALPELLLTEGNARLRFKPVSTWRERGETVLGGFAALVGVFIALAVLFVEISGNAYRKECLTAEGTVKKDWTYTWYAPLPFVFRPSEDGCVVHTGTRLALSKVGIAKVKPTTVQSISKRYADATGESDAAYWGPMKAAVIEFQKNSQNSKNFRDANAAIQQALDRIQALDPPPDFAHGHARLVDSLQRQKATSAKAATAIRVGDRSGLAQAKREAAKESADVYSALQELNRVKASQ